MPPTDTEYDDDDVCSSRRDCGMGRCASDSAAGLGLDCFATSSRRPKLAGKDVTGVEVTGVGVTGVDEIGVGVSGVNEPEPDE